MGPDPSFSMIARLTAFGQMKGFFQNLGYQISPIHPSSAFHERAVDFPLCRVRVQAHL